MGIINHQPSMSDANPTRLISGNSNQKLAEQISQKMGIPLILPTIRYFANGEISVRIAENIQGYGIFIVQTGSGYENRTINDMIEELESLIDVCVRSDVKSISLIIPTFPYARSDKQDLSQSSVGSSRIVRKLFWLGASRIISMDLHSDQIVGFASGPFYNLCTVDLFIDFLSKNYFSESNKSDFILVSPDIGGTKRIESYASRLNISNVTMHKERDLYKNSVIIRSVIIGDVALLKDKTAIIIDDMIDTAGTMISAANELMEYGVKKIIIMITHGILSDPAIQRINDCKIIADVITTNTIDQTSHMEKCDKIRIIDVSDIFARIAKPLI